MDDRVTRIARFDASNRGLVEPQTKLACIFHSICNRKIDTKQFLPIIQKNAFHRT